MKRISLILFLVCMLTVCLGMSSASGTDDAYEMLVYSPSDGIQIQYPRFTGPGTEALNELVFNHVLRMTDLEVDPTDVTLDYQAAVTLYNSKIVSIVFWGYSNVFGSAHPFTELYPFNIDLATLQQVTIGDLYTINPELGTVFFEKAYFPTDPVTSYSAEDFAEMLMLQTPEYQTFDLFSEPGYISCFFKPDGLVFTMSAVHATGSDHFEAEVPYADLQPFYLPAQNYWEE
jgi:hypothetical protein